MQLADLVRDYGRTLVEALAGCCFLAATWAAQRTKRWLLELLERERLASEQQSERHREREMRRHNETLRTLFEASVTGEQPTLGSLLDSAERDWSLESSPEPFMPTGAPPRPDLDSIESTDEPTRALPPPKRRPPNER